MAEDVVDTAVTVEQLVPIPVPHPTGVAFGFQAGDHGDEVDDGVVEVHQVLPPDALRESLAETCSQDVEVDGAILNAHHRGLAMGVDGIEELVDHALD